MSNTKKTNTKKTPAKKTAPKKAAPRKSSIPTLEEILGIEVMPQFQLLGRVINADRLTLSDQVRIGAAGEDLEAQVGSLVQVLNPRISVGEEFTLEEVMDGIDIQAMTRLFMMLSGQFTPRVQGGSGK